MVFQKSSEFNFKFFSQFAVFALAAVVNCEAPGGYNYNRPSVGGGSSAGGSSFGGSGGSAISSGGGYQQEAIGGNTQEGLTVDPQLLDQIRQILLKEESQNGGGQNGGGGRGGGGQPSSQYGAPQPQYGPPQQSQARVVGIILENTIPAIQVAQYRSQSSAGGSAGGFAGYPSGPSSFGGVAPQVSAPSSNYGAPF